MEYRWMSAIDSTQWNMVVKFAGIPMTIPVEYHWIFHSIPVEYK